MTEKSFLDLDRRRIISPRITDFPGHDVGIRLKLSEQMGKAGAGGVAVTCMAMGKELQKKVRIDFAET